MPDVDGNGRAEQGGRNASEAGLGIPDAVAATAEARQALEQARAATEQHLGELAGRRESLLRELRDLEERRAETDAERSALAGRIAAQRARLEYVVEDAQERLAQSDPFDNEAAQNSAREARARLAELEAERVEQEGELNRQLTIIDARRNAVQNDIARVTEEYQAVREEQRRIEADRQATRAEELEAELQRLAPLVEAQREAAGVSGIADLSLDYSTRAAEHQRQWRVWGLVLVGMLLAALVGGVLLLILNHPPKDAKAGAAISREAVNVFVVGVLLYAVRLAALQFRVHRHMEAVAQNKAAALSTFNRIVAVASEPEVRTTLATVLAQNVFSSDETGFVDNSAEQVTLIERIAGPVVQRASS